MKKVMNGRSKKMLAGMLALSLAVPSTVWAGASLIKEDETAAGTMFQLGDVNGDGKVKLDDAQITLKIALNLRPVSETEKKAADTDNNGKVELKDAQKILRWALNLDPVPSPEPVESGEPVTSSAPAGSSTPEQSATPAPQKSDIPDLPPAPPESSSRPAPSKTPVPVGASLEPVSPAAYVVSADKAVLAATNGALEEDDIYTFTDANKENAKGIRFLWPYIGRKELVEDLTQAGVSVADIVSVPAEKLLKPSNEEDKKNWDFEYEYPRPKWNTGMSVSFWSKEKWQSENQSNLGVLMVLKRTKYCDDHEGVMDGGHGSSVNRHGQKGDCDYALVVRSNGTVIFLAGDEAKNGFRTTNYTMGSDNEWNHYTITIANDWVQIYVNGQEMAYVGVDLDKDASSENFNKGFMTRYNPAGLLNQSIVDADVRKYLTSPSAGGRNSAWYMTKDINGNPTGYDTNWEATLIGNSRYKTDEGTIAGFDRYATLMELLTSEGTELWLGGVETCCVSGGNQTKCEYSTPTGAQVTDVQCYDKELKADEVAAVYEDSLNRCETKLKLNK